MAGLQDAEALFYMVRTLVRLGAHDRGVIELGRVVAGGFWCYDTLMRDPWLEPIRRRPDFQRLLRDRREHVADASVMFRNAHGPELIGLATDQAWRSRAEA